MNDKREFTAWHEAGHLVEACLFGVRVKEAYISESGGGATVLEESSRPLPPSLLTEIYAAGMAGAIVYAKRIRSMAKFSLNALLTHVDAQDGAEEDIHNIRSMNREMTFEEIEKHVRLIAEGLDYGRLKRFAKALLQYGHLDGETIIRLWNRGARVDRLVRDVDLGLDKRIPRWLKFVGPWLVWIVLCVLLFYYRSAVIVKVAGGVMIITAVMLLFDAIAMWTWIKGEQPGDEWKKHNLWEIFGSLLMGFCFLAMGIVWLVG
jgi:hypothetical protein